MRNKNDDNDGRPLTDAEELRRHAEELIRGVEYPGAAQDRSNDEMLKLVHELQVHQVELEMQNAELRLARDEVETALGKYAELYDFAPVGYFTLDRDGIIRSANLAGARLLGIERARLVGRRFMVFVPVGTRPFFADFLGKVFASGDKESCEVEITTEGNTPLFLQAEAVAFASGDECRVAVIDITERRQLAEQLEILHTDLTDYATKLADANIELEAFNFTVSHDLRRPLTNIHAYCQLLRELGNDKLDEQSKDFVREIFEGALRMDRLIATLLDFSLVKRVDLRREKVDLSAMAKTVAAELESAEPDSRVKFLIAEGITADCDAGVMRVALDNLMGNAWKFLGKQEGKVIEFGATAVDGKQAYFIRDNGPGFDMSHAGELFVPFQRLPETDVEGHGIGLATVDRIIRRHGGRVWAESEPGKGATFLFTLE